MPLVFLSLFCHHLGDDEMAREYSQQALQIPFDPEDRTPLERYWCTPLFLSYTLAGLGHVLVDLEQPEQAAGVYRSAIDRMRGLRPLLTLEPSAGLAGVLLAQGNPEGALEIVQACLPCLEAYPVSDELLEPFRVHLICYRVLRANEDPRARQVLRTAHGLLEEQATKIDHGETQLSFLEKIAVRREIVKEWERLTDDPAPER
jgi:tetratricopeptide (TPR) repeat protein